MKQKLSIIKMNEKIDKLNNILEPLGFEQVHNARYELNINNEIITFDASALDCNLKNEIISLALEKIFNHGVLTGKNVIRDNLKTLLTNE